MKLKLYGIIAIAALFLSFSTEVYSAITSGSFASAPTGWAFPIMATDNSGNTYLAYKINSTTITVKKHNGTTWSDLPNITAANSGNAGYSDDLGLAVDGLGNVHVVFRHDNGGGVPSTRGISYAFYNGTNWTFTSIDEASCGSGCKNYDDPFIAIDGNNKVHIAYGFRFSFDPSEYYIRHASNETGAWVIDNVRTWIGTAAASGINELFPYGIYIDGNNDIYVVYGYDENQNTVPNIYYNKRTAGVWGVNTLYIDAVSTGAYAVWAGLQFDASNKIYTANISQAAADNYETIFKTNKSGLFTSTTLTDQAGRDDGLAGGLNTEHGLRKDASGNMYLFSTSYNTTDWTYYFYFRGYNGTSWSNCTQVAQLDPIIGKNEYNYAITSTGKVVVVWTMYDDPSGAGWVMGDIADFLPGGCFSPLGASPSISSATYNASTGALVVTGANLEANAGGADINATKFTITGQGGATRTLSTTANVEITSATSFTLSVVGADKTALDNILNKNGLTSVGGTTFNIAAAADWCTNFVGGADLTDNGIDVSGVTSTSVSTISPANSATNVVLNSSISVTFNIPMNPATLTAQTVSGAPSGSVQLSSDNFITAIGMSASAGTMSNGNTTVTFTPATNLNMNTTYKIRVTTAATSANAIPLPAQYTAANGFTTINVNNPTLFAATGNSTSQIALTWTLNGNSNPVLLAYNTSNTFGNPTGTYVAGNNIASGGTVLYVGTNTSINHTPLNANTQYYYKIWSKDGSDNYSTGTTDNDWTYANVPSAPTVGVASETSLNVSINANANPASTEFAIHVTATGVNLFVQTDGTLGASAAWATAAAWGNKTVTGLTTGLEYTFEVKARNGANIETAYSTTAAGIPADPPTIQSSNLMFTNITRTGMTISWTKGDGDGSLLLGREQYKITSSPLTDGVVYNGATPVFTSAPTVGGAKLLYNNTDATPSVVVTGLTKYKLYYFKVCEFNNEVSPYYLQTENATNPRSRWTLRKEGVGSDNSSEFIYPNPATNEINYDAYIPEASDVKLEIFSGDSRLVKIINFGHYSEGYAKLTADISELRSGTYLAVYHIGAESFVALIDVVK